ncbi:hypothetical protein L4X63_15030 [Geomonas sp. Red32]|uniref:hypothetical protein n=1 Tax=Geomonas sp. Red32 TaxID=2912856 RepID=UPI00202D0941|nr:hypothetical protein [Geomonas sp. Red32]MCM0082906.1 hypothetical protein [Geomonas sp. Red32]
MAFLAAVIFFTAFSLWPIWTIRFLPMQDYPQHLFLSHLAATYHDPAFNWPANYTVDFGFRPYHLWYLAMAVLTLAVKAEVAGKILVSLYILLVSRLALKLRQLSPGTGEPWGALLLFPFAFNQMYYLGFPNFILTLPLVFLALLDLDSFSLSDGRLIRHGALCLVIFLAHPYAALVYMVLATVWVCPFPPLRRDNVARLLPALVMAIVFAAWYLTSNEASSAPTKVPWGISWWPLRRTVAFYLLPFTGMRISHGCDWMTIAVWSVLAVTLGRLLWLSRVGTPRRLLAVYIATTAGFLVLPFYAGFYTYFNLRLAPFSYFAMVLAMTSVPVPPRSRVGLIGAVALLLFSSSEIHRAVAAETESILPVLSAMKKNAAVLPLIADGSSRRLDATFFSQAHDHDTDYYHLLVGGGVSPTLFPNAMMPVQLRDGSSLPLPDPVATFSWERHGACYDYLLARNPMPGLRAILAEHCTLKAVSGPWELYKTKGRIP